MYLHLVWNMGTFQLRICNRWIRCEQYTDEVGQLTVGSVAVSSWSSNPLLMLIFYETEN